MSSKIEKLVEVKIGIKKSKSGIDLHLNNKKISGNDELNSSEILPEVVKKEIQKRVILFVDEGSIEETFRDGIIIHSSEDEVIEIREYPGF